MNRDYAVAKSRPDCDSLIASHIFIKPRQKIPRFFYFRIKTDNIRNGIFKFFYKKALFPIILKSKSSEKILRNFF